MCVLKKKAGFGLINLNINYSIYSSYVALVLQKRHETSVAWPAYNVVRHSSSQVSDFVSIYIS